jgi:hypothetical protein
MRSTTAGFSALHLAVFLLVLGAGAVWAFAFRNSPETPVLASVLSKESFAYWTIVHVTLSWMPRV